MALRGRNAHYLIAEIQTRHWQALAKACGVPSVWGLMRDMASSVEDAIASVMVQLPRKYPEALAESIFDGELRQAAKFLSEVKSI